MHNRARVRVLFTRSARPPSPHALAPEPVRVFSMASTSAARSQKGTQCRKYPRNSRLTRSGRRSSQRGSPSTSAEVYSNRMPSTRCLIPRKGDSANTSESESTRHGRVSARLRRMKYNVKVCTGESGLTARWRRARARAAGNRLQRGWSHDRRSTRWRGCMECTPPKKIGTLSGPDRDAAWGPSRATRSRWRRAGG